MKRIDQLTRIVAKESEYVEKLGEIMEKKQEAIVRMNADDLAAIVQAEEQIIVPLQTLEEERNHLLHALTKEIPQYSSADTSSLIGVDVLMPFISEEEAMILSDHVTKLRNTVTKIVHLNESNKALIVHSHRFVQEMLKILTDNYKRQFVDQKM